MPGSLDSFHRVRAVRRRVEQPWLPELVRFDRYRGRRLLEVGCGAGFDAYDICSAGADYTGIDITPQNVERTSRALIDGGFTSKIVQADAEQLPFPDASFDVVFSNGVLHHTPDIRSALREAWRVLRPEGDAWVIVYHRNSIFHWVSLFLVDHILRLGFRHMSFRERLARIEYTTSDALPLVNVYGRGEFARLMEGAGFRVDGSWVRKLNPEDLPSLPILARLWPRVPQRWLDRLGERFGWYIIVKASKAPDAS
jgi:ubiquinone/menaquinone biosynthesis C-methylase UbiE